MTTPADDPAQSLLWDEDEVDGVAAPASGPEGHLHPVDDGPDEPEPDALDWHSRRLLSQLYHAVVSHLEASDEEPSSELLIILGQVKGELQA